MYFMHEQLLNQNCNALVHPTMDAPVLMAFLLYILTSMNILGLQECNFNDAPSSTKAIPHSSSLTNG